MRTRFLGAAALALAVVLPSCSDTAGTAPGVTALPIAAALVGPVVRISEIHYDNSGTDTGESIEVSAPVGTDLTGWSVVLYNGNGGASYNTRSLTGLATTTCTNAIRKVVVLTYPTDGIQNGSPDGMALVNAAGQVIEFLSYEGTFTAVGGPANGMPSTDIVAFQSGAPLGQTLQRSSADVWAAAASTLGACNDEDDLPPAEVATVTVDPASATIAVGEAKQLTATAKDATGKTVTGVQITWSTSNADVATVSATGLVTGTGTGDVTITAASPNDKQGTSAIHVDAAPPPPATDVRLSEIHYDNSGTDVGEAIEVWGTPGTSLAGWSIVLYNGGTNPGPTYGSPVALTGTLPTSCDGRGVAVVNIPGIQNGDPDGFALVNPSGQAVEFFSYGGSFTASNGPAAGKTSVDMGVKESGTGSATRSLQRRSDLKWYGPIPASFGVCNSEVPFAEISFTGRVPSDVPLPVGFEDQIFASLTIDGVGQPSTAWTWTSETPSVASIDADGVIRALSAGSAVFRATAPDGNTRTWTLPTTVATEGGTAQYANNVEFGIPHDANTADDMILSERAQYVTSWNPTRRIPNWVSYEFDATHFGTLDRCDCFTYDPELPQADRYTTAAYTGSAAINGFSIDRGHLARSFDRTTGALDNARTFYFSNIIPQASENNQGPWASLETDLGNLARNSGKEVYVIAGASGNKGTLKNEGKIVIPEWTWKVAVVMPRDKGLADVHAIEDVEQVIAVVMPNVNGIRNVPWTSYKVTVDSVEKLSGYDVLDLLNDQIEIALESNTKPPVAVVSGPVTIDEGSAPSLSAAGSSDPDAGQTLTYAWSFGDGSTGTGVTPTHVYTQDGSYTVTLTVSDPLGLTATATTTVTVTNVAPALATFPGATLLPGETYGATGNFTDPGADAWTATVNYGDGGATQPLALSGQSFTLSHQYAAAGSFTVTVVVNDDDASDTRTALVKVMTYVEASTAAIGLVTTLRQTGTIDDDQANAMRSKLENARRFFENGDSRQAVNILKALVKEIDLYIADGVLTTTEAAPLKTLVLRIIASAS